MIHEKIDLYEYFRIPRGEHKGGYLTTYARARNFENTNKERPAALVIPGGAYNMISFREGEPIALRFLGEGYSVFLLEYSCKTAYPVPLVEAAMAMAYIRQNAEKYFIRGGHVCAIGFSAGGHLAGMLSTRYADDCIKAVLGDAHVRPDAAILSYAVSTTDPALSEHDTAHNITGGDPALRALLSNEKNVTKDRVPAFIWHTAEDGLVPVENSLMLAAAYRRAGVPFELHIFERGRHGLSTADAEVSNFPDDGGTVESVQAWLPLAFAWLKERGFEVR